MRLLYQLGSVQWLRTPGAGQRELAEGRMLRLVSSLACVRLHLTPATQIPRRLSVDRAPPFKTARRNVPDTSTVDTLGKPVRGVLGPVFR